MKRKCACVTELHLWMCRLTCYYGMAQSKLQTQVKTKEMKEQGNIFNFPIRTTVLEF